MPREYKNLAELCEARDAGEERNIDVYVDIDEYYFNDENGDTLYKVMADELVEESLHLCGFSKPKKV